MPRTIDPQRHEERRQIILAAVFTCVAKEGFERATIASICAEAGIGSGTFFHYFPTKMAALLALLRLGAAQTREWFAAQEGRPDPRAVVRDYVDRVVDDLADPRFAGFVTSVAAIMATPDVAAALADDTAAVTEGLAGWLTTAQAAATVRRDRGSDDLARWVQVIIDGFIDQVAVMGLNPLHERNHLHDAIDRLLA